MKIRVMRGRFALTIASIVLILLCLSVQAIGQFGVGLKLLNLGSPQLYFSREVAPQVSGELGISNGGFVTSVGISLSAHTKFALLRFELFETVFRPFIGTGFFITFFDPENSADSTTITYLGFQALVGFEYRGLVGLPLSTILELGSSISLPFRFSVQSNLGFRFDF